MTLLILSVEFNFLEHCQKASFCQELKSNLRHNLRNIGHLVSSNIRRTHLNHWFCELDYSVKNIRHCLVTKGTFDQGLKKF